MDFVLHANKLWCLLDTMYGLFFIFFVIEISDRIGVHHHCTYVSIIVVHVCLQMFTLLCRAEELNNEATW